MPLSSVVGAQSIIKPGVCTSSTRPASPFEGQMIYETDTDKVLVWNGTDWYANWNLPWGMVARATSSTDYTLTTSAAIATGMTVTFTAIANRYYKITYMEPQCQTSTVADKDTNIQIRVTNAAGTLLNQGYIRTETGSQTDTGTITLVSTSTFSAGSTTIVGCAKTGSTSGAPVLGRGASTAGPALLLVEDIGPA
jgi:hypothetical protein